MCVCVCVRVRVRVCVYVERETGEKKVHFFHGERGLACPLRHTSGDRPQDTAYQFADC